MRTRLTTCYTSPPTWRAGPAVRRAAWPPRRAPAPAWCGPRPPAEPSRRARRAAPRGAAAATLNTAQLLRVEDPSRRSDLTLTLSLEHPPFRGAVELLGLLAGTAGARLTRLAVAGDAEAAPRERSSHCMRALRTLVVVAITVLVFVGGLVAGLELERAATSSGARAQGALYQQVLTDLQRDYYKPVNVAKTGPDRRYGAARLAARPVHRVLHAAGGQAVQPGA